MVKIEAIEGLGTHWWFELFDCSTDRSNEVTELLTKTIQIFNDAYSRFSHTSLIGRLNSGETIFKPPGELFELLAIADSWKEKSNGLFDISSGSELKRRGYDTHYSFTPNEDNFEAAQLLIENETVSLLQGHIDFGGFGKGFLIDKLVQLLIENDIQQFLINGGGDMYASHHTNEPIEVLIEHPEHKGRYIAKVPLLYSGLGVSSSYKRSWRTNETEYNHFVDSRSPSKTVRASSCTIAPTALQADVCATLLAIEPEQRMALDSEYTDYLIMHEQTFMSAQFKKYLL